MRVYNDRAARYYLSEARAETPKKLGTRNPLPRNDGELGGLTNDELRRAGWCPECKQKRRQCQCDLPPEGWAEP